MILGEELVANNGSRVTADISVEFEIVVVQAAAFYASEVAGLINKGFWVVLRLQ